MDPDRVGVVSDIVRVEATVPVLDGSGRMWVGFWLSVILLGRKVPVSSPSQVRSFYLSGSLKGRRGRTGVLRIRRTTEKRGSGLTAVVKNEILFFFFSRLIRIFGEDPVSRPAS